MPVATKAKRRVSKAKRATSNSVIVVARVKPYRHPGIPARPYLRPAAASVRPLYVKKIGDALDKIGLSDKRRLIREFNIVTKSMAFLAKTTAQKLAPKDTRRLSGSINTRKRAMMHWTVGTNVFYAPYQEFGVRPYNHPGIRPRNKRALAWKRKR